MTERAITREQARAGIDSCLRTIANAAPGKEEAVFRVQAMEAFGIAHRAGSDLQKVNDQLRAAGARLDVDPDRLDVILSSARTTPNGAVLQMPPREPRKRVANDDVPPQQRDHAQPPPSRPLRSNAKELRQMKFNPITFFVPGLIPAEGVTLICSKPKVGKSWLLLDTAIAATMNRFVLGEKRPTQGDVLYLALEDSLRRLQSRMTKLLPTFTGEWPDGLDFHTQWRRVDQGGLDDIRKWVTERRAAGRTVATVAIDVLKMVRPAMKKGQQQYDADYEAITGLQQLAMELGIAIIIAHHTRKAEAEDLIDKVSGTFGIVGAADTIIVIERRTAGAVFDVRGRDVEGDELAAEFNRDTCKWTILGDAGEIFRSNTKAKILAALGDSDAPLSPQVVAELTELSPANVKQTLRRMAQAGEVSHLSGGKYVRCR